MWKWLTALLVDVLIVSPVSVQGEHSFPLCWTLPEYCVVWHGGLGAQVAHPQVQPEAPAHLPQLDVWGPRENVPEDQALVCKCLLIFWNLNAQSASQKVPQNSITNQLTFNSQRGSCVVL